MPSAARFRVTSASLARARATVDVARLNADRAGELIKADAVSRQEYDNAMAESFFATLECELLDRQRFPTRPLARMAVFQFIEGWYNPHRRHSALGYLSPLNFEQQKSAA